MDGTRPRKMHRRQVKYTSVYGKGEDLSGAAARTGDYKR